MSNKQKAWRTAARKINADLGQRHSGRAAKNQHVKVLPFASTLLQGLLLRAGVWRAADKPGHDEAEGDPAADLPTFLRFFARSYGKSRFDHPYGGNVTNGA
jgi:hypothetical protein